MIRFVNVSKRYAGGREALNNLSFHLPAGKMCFLTGHSGAGKSTVLRLIAALEPSTSGQVLVGGTDLSSLSPRRIPYLRRQMGIVFQNHHLLYDRSVYENVMLPLLIAGYSPRDIARRARAALDKVGLLGKENAAPVSLSGGEQQRVGIARAVVNRPALLLADEPTGNLDPELSAEIMNLFAQFNQVGVTVLVASHDLNLIARLGYPIVSLDKGRLVHNSLRNDIDSESP